MVQAKTLKREHIQHVQERAKRSMRLDRMIQERVIGSKVRAGMGNQTMLGFISHLKTFTFTPEKEGLSKEGT